MKIKALVGFAGKISMARDEVRDCSDNAMVSELVRVGYVEIVKEPKEEHGKESEGKPEAEGKPETEEKSETPKKSQKRAKAVEENEGK